MSPNPGVKESQPLVPYDQNNLLGRRAHVTVFGDLWDGTAAFNEYNIPLHDIPNASDLGIVATAITDCVREWAKNPPDFASVHDWTATVVLHTKVVDDEDYHDGGRFRAGRLTTEVLSLTIPFASDAVTEKYEAWLDCA